MGEGKLSTNLGGDPAGAAVEPRSSIAMGVRRKTRRRGLVVVGVAAVLLTLGCQERAEGALRDGQPAPSITVAPPTEQPKATPASGPSKIMDVPALADAVRPAVVNITTTEKSSTENSSGDDSDPFQFFFRGTPGQSPPRLMGVGSGFIIDPSGYVVTNEHVVHDATRVRVKLADEREFDAEVVGRDPMLDVALLKLEDAKDLHAVKLGSSADLRVGEAVMAVGNPFGLGNTVTTGIVSAKERTLGLGPYDDFIQTDASINPGNSGGPLFDASGTVIGMNTAIRQGASGIGFAIPIDAIKEILPELRKTGHVARGRLGIAFQPMTSELAKAIGLPESTHGALVADVEPNGPAAKAGIQPRDVIVAVEGHPLSRLGELPREIARHSPGSKVQLTLIRDKVTRQVTATLETMKGEESASEKPAERGQGSDLEGWGLRVADAPAGGVLIYGISPNSDFGDLQPGDVIVSMDQTPIRNVEDLRAALGRRSPGTTVLTSVRRGETHRFVALRIPEKR
jgi:serine protease Do